MTENELTDELRAQYAAARARTACDDRIEPRAVKAWYDVERSLLMFELQNGCIFGFPPDEVADWGLDGVTPEQLAQVGVQDGGRLLYWAAIEDGIVVPGLLLRLLNVKAWYAKWLGGAKSEAKAAAARENGKKGGRPRKQAAAPEPQRRRRAARTGE